VRRAAWGVAGLLWFFWIAYEDRGLEALSFVAAAIAFAAGLTALNRWVGSEMLSRRAWLMRTAGVGLVVGAAIGPITALLMLLKLGLHAHPDPDFGLEQFVLALTRTVYWAGLGALIGFALGYAVRETRI
jgi:hypothetical protein